MTAALVRDAELPTLARALDPETMKPLLGARRVHAIRVVRHKPGRRCLVEYDVELGDERLLLLGKIRAGRPNRSGFHLLEAFRRAGFDESSSDRIRVPEPVAVIPELHLWLQRKVPGSPAGERLRPELADRIAGAAHKIHRAGVPTARRHTVADELRILRDCLAVVASRRPEWTARLARVGARCEGLGTDLAGAATCGIHRDFYADQLLVDRDFLTIVDFDLYCDGDPALDAGNFLGHVTEQSLRLHGDPDALTPFERRFEDRFVALAGEQIRARVRAYQELTLVRHIFLSAQRPERHALTPRLLDLCESRLGLG